MRGHLLERGDRVLRKWNNDHGYNGYNPPTQKAHLSAREMGLGSKIPQGTLVNRNIGTKIPAAKAMVVSLRSVDYSHGYYPLTKCPAPLSSAQNSWAFLLASL